MRQTSHWKGATALAACVAALAVPLLFSQAPAGPAFQLKAFGMHKAMAEASPFKALSWQSIGPANNTGRMTAIAVADDNGKRTIYVGAASGGVWKSPDGGATFTGYQAGGGDNHRMWIDPDNPKITYVAHDGGFVMTQDGRASSGTSLPGPSMSSGRIRPCPASCMPGMTLASTCQPTAGRGGTSWAAICRPGRSPTCRFSRATMSSSSRLTAGACGCWTR